MRIVAGRFRGMALASVGKGDPAAHLRPTTDRVRESLFNILTSGRLGDAVSGARVLDLFAGTGALGLEALSRGAAHVTFVETGRAALRLLEKNIAATRTGPEVTLLRRDATRAFAPVAEPATLVFLDPPYGTEAGALALAAADAAGAIAPGALIAWEDDRAHTTPAGFSLEDTRRFGGTWITFLRKDGTGWPA